MSRCYFQKRQATGLASAAPLTAGRSRFGGKTGSRGLLGDCRSSSSPQELCGYEVATGFSPVRKSHADSSALREGNSGISRREKGRGLEQNHAILRCRNSFFPMGAPPYSSARGFFGERKTQRNLGTPGSAIDGFCWNEKFFSRPRRVIRMWSAESARFVAARP